MTKDDDETLDAFLRRIEEREGIKPPRPPMSFTTFLLYIGGGILVLGLLVSAAHGFGINEDEGQPVNIGAYPPVNAPVQQAQPVQRETQRQLDAIRDCQEAQAAVTKAQADMYSLKTEIARSFAQSTVDRAIRQAQLACS